MIAQKVWEAREDNLLKGFEESDGEELETTGLTILKIIKGFFH
jgi:hypothetical protein